MSWNVCALVVRTETRKADYQSFLERIGVGEPRYTDTLGFDEAMDEIARAGTGVAIGCSEGWTSVWGELLFLSEDVERELSKGTRLMWFMSYERSDMQMFAWWVDGVRLRKRHYQESEVCNEEGAPLPEELALYKAEKDEEDRVFVLMSKLCLPFRRLTKPKFDVFETSL
jgi:hypothetical protein